MKKRHHLTIQIMVMICVLAAGAILVCWLMNSIFLERYYVQQKKQNMVEDFELLSDAGADSILQSEEFDATFDSICANGNMTVLILSWDGRVIRTSAADRSTLRDDMYNLLWDENPGVTVQLGENYEILSKQDSRLESEYLYLIGTLSNGDWIMMRTALESIRESAALSNRLLLFVGLIMIGVSMFFGGFMALRITRPILQLAGISKKMVNLDFEAKYVPGAWRKDPDLRVFRARRRTEDSEEENVAGNEIDLLGNHMNRLSEALERTISELKSANLSLQQDIEKKTQIDEMRREFLSNVSHELKTPIALIQGYAEGLQENINDDPESREYYAEIIIEEAGRMNGMVQELLTLNQLESGEDKVVMERFDLTEMIKGVCSASGILMEKQGIRLDTSGLDVMYVWGEALDVESAFTNFLSNAIHHCGGEKMIRIFYTKRGDIVRVSVFNTGDPIPEGDIEHIWDKFYKVDKSRSREYGGSGIGLSIVKAVMDSLGQECGVENHADGVEFWMELATK